VREENALKPTTWSRAIETVVARLKPFVSWQIAILASGRMTPLDEHDHNPWDRRLLDEGLEVGFVIDHQDRRCHAFLRSFHNHPANPIIAESTAR